MNKEELQLMQNYPLWMKVEKTKRRIQEWYEYWDGNVYVSFSGGKDSTVLVHICRELYPDIPVVFINTGVEYPEVVKHVKTFENITVLRPAMPFHKIIKEYGYPLISKDVSHVLGIVQRNGMDCKTAERFKPGNGRVRYDFSRYAYLVNAPFKIDSKCCEYLKTKPIHEYEATTGRKPILGTMAIESQRRTNSYLNNGGCNAFEATRPTSTPLGFWTDQDIFSYIVENNIAIPSVYGQIIKHPDTGKYITTGLRRTGCMYCPFGVKHDGYPNRYQRLQHTHPKHYDYMLNKLGFKQVFDFVGIEYKDNVKRLF